MAIQTNKSDVISNFVRYHGRQPENSDMATIDYLTTKSPMEVEQLLAKDSPITNGLVWSDYQNQGKTVDEIYSDAVAKNPAVIELAKGGSSVDEIINALSTGDLSGVADWNGQPFDAATQQEALSKANEDNKLYYEALQSKERADTEASIAKDQEDYQNYLINSGQQFEENKSELDQKAADSGVLFSGGRAQREKNLERAYNQDQTSQQNKVSRNIGNSARDYQYKYGNNEANGLNKYYNVGGNTYNSKVASGGVGSAGISNIYNPEKYNYQGTRNTERSSASNVRAADYLKNRGNKLLSTGYNNQL